MAADDATASPAPLASMSVETIPLKVSTWGIPAVMELVLERPITFAGDATTTATSPQDCVDG